MTTFGAYELLRLVARGGMGEVYLARQVRSHGYVKPCVVKRVIPDRQNKGTLALFWDEARLSALLTHPNIVQTLDFGEVDGAPYMALELIDGISLGQLLVRFRKDGRALPMRVALEIGAAVADALDYAHHLKSLDDGSDLRVVHRDVSPQNVLISRQGNVKLADFGIARHEARAEQTQDARVKGKPGYIAPEQAMMVPCDHRVDLFALGIVIYEMISMSRGVVAAGDLASLPDRIRKACVGDAGPGVASLCVSMVAPDPNDRPSNARDVAVRLRAEASKLAHESGLTDFSREIFATVFLEDPMAAFFRTPSPATADRTLIDARPPAFTADATAALYGSIDLELVEDESIRAEAPLPLPRVVSLPMPEPVRAPLERAPSQRSPSVIAREDSARIAAPRGESQRRLSLPTPGDPASARKAPADVPLEINSKMLATFGAAADDLVSKSRPSDRKPLLLLGGAVTAFGLLAVLSAVAIVGRPFKPAGGVVVIESTTPGAAIYINNVRTDLVTPAKVDVPYGDTEVRVVHDDYAADPERSVITVSKDDAVATTAFTMHPARTVRVVSEPAGATVTLNGKIMPGRTPLQLEKVVRDAPALLRISHEGYVVQSVHLTASTTVASVRLETGRLVEIYSEPEGAKVFLSGTEVGATPMLELMVPTRGSFTLRVEHGGYHAWSRDYAARKFSQRSIQVDLHEVIP